MAVPGTLAYWGNREPAPGLIMKVGLVSAWAWQRDQREPTIRLCEPLASERESGRRHLCINLQYPYELLNSLDAYVNVAAWSYLDAFHSVFRKLDCNMRNDRNTRCPK